MVATLLIEQELLTGSTTGSASASGYTMTSAQNPEICWRASPGDATRPGGGEGPCR